MKITAHAILRYHERVENMDIQAVTAEMDARGYAEISPKTILDYLWTRDRISTNATGQKIRAMIAAGVQSHFGDWIVCPDCVFGVTGDAVTTTLTHAQYEWRVKQRIAAMLRRDPEARIA